VAGGRRPPLQLIKKFHHEDFSTTKSTKDHKGFKIWLLKLIGDLSGVRSVNDRLTGITFVVFQVLILP
jgi:hypothetical protein